MSIHSPKLFTNHNLDFFTTPTLLLCYSFSVLKYMILFSQISIFTGVCGIFTIVDFSCLPFLFYRFVFGLFVQYMLATCWVVYWYLQTVEVFFWELYLKKWSIICIFENWNSLPNWTTEQALCTYNTMFHLLHCVHVFLLWWKWGCHS